MRRGDAKPGGILFATPDLKACIERYAARLLDAGSTPATSTISSEPVKVHIIPLVGSMPVELGSERFCKPPLHGAIPWTGSIYDRRETGSLPCAGLKLAWVAVTILYKAACI